MLPGEDLLAQKSQRVPELVMNVETWRQREDLLPGHKRVLLKDGSGDSWVRTGRTDAGCCHTRAPPAGSKNGGGSKGNRWQKIATRAGGKRRAGGWGKFVGEKR